MNQLSLFLFINPHFFLYSTVTVTSTYMSLARNMTVSTFKNDWSQSYFNSLMSPKIIVVVMKKIVIIYIGTWVVHTCDSRFIPKAFSTDYFESPPVFSYWLTGWFHCLSSQCFTFILLKFVFCLKWCFQWRSNLSLPIKYRQDFSVTLKMKVCASEHSIQRLFFFCLHFLIVKHMPCVLHAVPYTHLSQTSHCIVPSHSTGQM